MFAEKPYGEPCEKCNGTNTVLSYNDTITMYCCNECKFMKILENKSTYVPTEADRKAMREHVYGNHATCPYCHSSNTTKIGVIGRSISFGIFGFGSSKVGKQWHCNSCKSDF